MVYGIQCCTELLYVVRSNLSVELKLLTNGYTLLVLIVALDTMRFICTYAVAATVALPLIETVGVLSYPLPGLVTVMLMMLRLALPVIGPLILAIAVAPLPRPSVLVIVITGTLAYPLPEFCSRIELTFNVRLSYH